MTLRKYASKRILAISKEPPAVLSRGKNKELKFVIQKHAASHLHYDFRLEVDGVLKSWAIPKGLSLDPQVKRLAMMVEDHPYDYRKFEGVIPKGYGAGAVIVWDQGTYRVEGESKKDSEKLMREGLKKGILHFSLEGEKVRGEFSLVRMKKEGSQWLLIKKSDAFVSDVDLTRLDTSVISGKTLEEISEKKAIIKGVRRKKPTGVKPMLTTLVDKPFDDDEWIFEIKLDGFRALAALKGPEISLYSRNFQSFNKRFPLLAEELKSLNLDAIFDGEIVSLDKKGISHFQDLQHNQDDKNIYFYVFDILYLNGRDLRALSLMERKKLLKEVLKSAPDHIRFLDHIEAKGKSFFDLCKKQGCEGIIGKQKNSPYKSGIRSKKWVKIKAEMEQEVVICGFTEPRKGRKNFGALLVGIYKNGKLKFAGHVGGGFSHKKLQEVKELLLPFVAHKCPFETLPKTNTPATWVKPKLLCNVKFKQWTQEGFMRQPIFIALREDKPAKQVIKEKPIKSTKIRKKAITTSSYNFITNAEKLFWEKEGITKGETIAYYEAIAPILLPYLKDRPESLRRFPNGILKPSFFQKNLTSHPQWVSTVEIEHEEKMVKYLVIQDKESLLYAVNLGCIEIHPWFSRHQAIDNPDYLIFDLDPEGISFEAVIETALALHEILEELAIPSVCKTSGGRGLHIGIPLKAKYSYDQAKQFALLIAMLVHKQLPTITSLERSPKKRQKKVYIDCFQNNFGQTLAAPYALRAKPGAPVSTPLQWKEVKKGLNPLDYNIYTILGRLKKVGDLFKPLLGKGIDMQKAIFLVNKKL